MGHLSGRLVFALGGDVTDNYKAKVMRGMLPPPYNNSYGSVISTLLATIGRSDNFIGGLFGTADFLPDFQ